MIIDILLYLLTFTSSIGASIGALSIAGVQMTVFRMVLVVIFVFTIIKKPVVPILSKSNAVYNFTLILVLYSLITLLWVKNISDWIQFEFFILEGLVLVIVMKMCLINIKRIGICLYGFEATVLLQMIIGVSEMITGIYRFAPDNQVYYITRYGINSPVGTMYNINNFGVLMLFGVAVELILYEKSKKMWEKIIHLLLVIVFSMMVYFSTSRASFIGMILLYTVLLAFFLKNKLNKLMISVIAIITCFGTFAYIRNMFTIDIVSDGIRLNLIKNGIYFLRESLFLGIGSGQTGWWLENKTKYPVHGLLALHNWWIEILVCYGIVIFVYYICTYIKLIRFNFQMFKKNDNDIGIIAKGFSLFMIAYIIGSCSVSNAVFQEWYWVFWGVVVSFNVNIISILKNSKKQFRIGGL